METTRTCCCCLSQPPHRDMKTPYSHLGTGNTEIYSEMLTDCFGIQVVLGNHECGICKMCVRRLRDASNFKLQVQRSQAELQARLDSKLLIKDEEPEIKSEMSQNENLQDMLMLNEPVKSDGPDVMGDDESFSSNEEAMISERESPVSSLCEEKLEQTYPVEFEDFSDDEAVHQKFSHRPSLATQTYQTHNSLKNPPNNNFGVRKEKKRHTRQVQSEKENVMVYPLRSKITFKRERPLNDYRNTYSTGPYTCEICQKVIATKRSMTCHMQNHLEPKSEIREDNTWDCDICEKIFTTKMGMKTHMANVHSNKTFKCDICFKRYRSILYLNLHKRIHDERTRDYCCEICGQQFFYKSLLSSHVKTHSEEKQYTCDICQKHFRDKSTLEGHIHAHMGVKPYSCKCGKKYSHLPSYKKHELQQHKKPRQERERAFVCEICNKRFLESHHLKKHKLVHTGEKPYACETCGKQLATKCSLKIHILTHVKDKAYSCYLCPKKYSTKEGLRQHKRIHTGKKNMKTKGKNKNG